MVGSAISGVSRMLGGGSKNRRILSSKYQRGRVPTAQPGRVGNYPSVMRPVLRTPGGRSLKLAFSIAPIKKDIVKLRAAIGVNARGIKQAVKGIKANAKSAVATSKRVTALDRKHTLASQAQNRIMNTLNKRVITLKKGQDDLKQQSQMMMMLSLMMKPEMESITVINPKETNFNTTKDKENILTVKETTEKEDNTMLMLLLSGGLGGGSSSDNMMNNPLMLMALMGKL